APLEAAVAKLTSRAPDKLCMTGTARARERLEAELERQLARLEGDDDGGDADWYLDEYVFEGDDGHEIVVTDAYPRNAGRASGTRRPLRALRLPPGSPASFRGGEGGSSRIVAVAARDMDDEAAAAFGEIIALPTYFNAGGGLLEIDRHLSVCRPGSW